MAVTKTKFINYMRCPRYAALDNIHEDRLDADVSFKDYKEEEYEELLDDLLGRFYEEDAEGKEIDLINITDKQLETLLPYYNKVELLAGKVVNNKLDGKPKYSASNYYQEKFDVNINGIKYLCYVDIFNDRKDSFDIIEVKATTSKKFAKLGGNVDKEFVPVFEKNEKGIYQLTEELDVKLNEKEQKKYDENKAKLTKRFDDCGRYVYDLAVQRYIIENDLKEKLPKNVRYYLAVLNHEYVYDGISDYEKDENGNEIISLIDLTQITKDMMDIIDKDKKNIEKYIFESDASPCRIGPHCEHKKTTKCKFCDKECFNHIPKYNSVFSYILIGKEKFKDESDNSYSKWDLIDLGFFDMLDIPTNYLQNNPKHMIQYDTVKNNSEFVKKEKIQDGISCLTYPIYHLDFETFPCPLPRNKGESPYTQSVFQFSLHIEKEPGLCDKNKNHHEFLSPDLKDHRKELVEKLCKYIENDGGSVLVYNKSFEETRLRELSEIFPEYKSKLLSIRERVFDLLHIIKSNTKLYKELGYSEEEAKIFNYYHKDLDGSFSIKKVLPVFSDLTYDGLNVADGMEAFTTFAKFEEMTKEEYKEKYEALIEYCKQDTWAMFEILQELIKLSEENS